MKQGDKNFSFFQNGKLFWLFAFILSCLISLENVQAASPTFSGSTPENYAVVANGAMVSIGVDSDDAVGAEHTAVFDWNQKLVGWWRFNTDGNLTDYSSYGNSMTSHGATWTSSGKYAGAYNYDAAADYLSVSDADLNIGSSDPYTISVWIKPNGTSNNTVMQLGEDGSSGSYMAFLNAPNGGTPEFAIRQNWNGNWVSVTSSANLQSSSWNHIVVTNDRTNLRIYINGTLRGTQALGSFSTYTAKYSLMIGKNIWNNYFDGSIDDVQFYKRTLASTEILALYNGQTNQYSGSFTVSTGTYLYQAYTQDTSGNIDQTEQRTLYVNVTPPTRTLSYSAGANGSLSGSASQTVDIGSDGSAITAVPNTGYHFVNWSDDSTENPRTDENVAENISVTANFSIDTYSLTYAAGTGGTITGDVSQTVNSGSDGSAVTAVPDDGYHFVNWSDDSTENPRTDENVAENISVTANFELIPDEEETDNNNSSDPERAFIKSWSAFKYTDNNKSCSERLKLTIKGKHFDKDVEVYIGGKEASSINRKSSKELTAKFCLEKLLSDKTDHKRVISVKNPGTEERDADKQIDLKNIDSADKNEEGKNEKTDQDSQDDYFNQKTKTGAKQIQEALNKLGYLDAENITSTYGQITTEAVKKFQTDNGIEPTGFVGELTKAKLKEKA